MAIKSPKEITNTEATSTYWQKLETDMQSNQSKVSMVLGGLIILVAGILIFNYFNKSQTADLGPAQTTQSENTVEQDIAPEKLPGKYTIKEGDTLFSIAQKYYGDGYKYTNIASANNLTDPNAIEKGQVITIPTLDSQPVIETVEATMENQTSWGAKIEANSYTVAEGDWLSKIAGRAYGDIFSYDKIAKANNITNPNVIEPGMVLVIPR